MTYNSKFRNTFFTNDLVIKTEIINKSKLTIIKKRIFNIFDNNIPFIHVPNKISIHSLNSYESIIKLEFKWINGVDLYHFTKSQSDRITEEIKFNLKQIINSWNKNYFFVHGDISLKNIIIQPNNEITFIDWLIDLNNYAGTPYYASSEVYRGNHTFESDLYALNQTFKRMNRCGS